MGIRMCDFEKFVVTDADEEDDFGDAIAGTFSELEVDSVAAVRDLRRRT